MLSRYKDEKDRPLKVLQLRRVYLFYKKTLSKRFFNHLQFTLKFKFYFNKKYSCTISLLNKQFKIKKATANFRLVGLRHVGAIFCAICLSSAFRDELVSDTMVSYYRSNYTLTGKSYLDSPIPGRVSSTAQDANYWGPVTVPSRHKIENISGDYVPHPLQTLCGFFNVPQNLYLQGS